MFRFWKHKSDFLLLCGVMKCCEINITLQNSSKNPHQHSGIHICHFNYEWKIQGRGGGTWGLNPHLLLHTHFLNFLDWNNNLPFPLSKTSRSTTDHSNSYILPLKPGLICDCYMVIFNFMFVGSSFDQIDYNRYVDFIKIHVRILSKCRRKVKYG